LIRVLLEREGFDIHEACDGLDALTKASAGRPDVILMDAEMPRLDGFECTRRLTADPACRDIPIIMVSGKTDERHIEAGFEAGAKEYITKPIRHREFVLRVRAMTELHRSKANLAKSNEVRGEQARAMELLFDLSRSLAAVDSTEEIVERTVAATAELLGCHRVSIMLPDQGGEHLLIAQAIGLEEALCRKIRVPVGSDIAGRVYASGKPTVLNTPHEEGAGTVRYDSDFFASVPLASHALAVPKKVLGVLNVTDRHDGTAFEARDLEYLDLVCNMTASALEQVQARSGREHAHTAIVTGLAKLAEHRDANTGNHLERVTEYALLLAEELRHKGGCGPEIDDEFLEHLHQAMPLHDIGKVAVPDSILHKPDKLTEAEFAIMKRHAEVGASAIQSVIEKAPEAGFLPMARDIAHFHHERFDGSGYPRGLRGDEIPLAARIAAVADVYDALTTKRPYKEAFPHEKAARIIRDSSGTHFDPDVVGAFQRLERDFADLAAKLEDEVGDARDPETARALELCSADAASFG